MFCNKLKHLIEENSPRVFAKLTRTNFEEHFKGEITDNTVIKKFENQINYGNVGLFRFIADFVKGLYIDNRNIAQPVVSYQRIWKMEIFQVTYDYLETQHRGEIRYEDHNEPTPFFPK